MKGLNIPEYLGFFRIDEVLAMIPISESGWWEGCRQGIYPKPYKLGVRKRGWKKQDILELIDSFEPV